MNSPPVAVLRVCHCGNSIRHWILPFIIIIIWKSAERVRDDDRSFVALFSNTQYFMIFIIIISFCTTENEAGHDSFPFVKLSIDCFPAKNEKTANVTIDPARVYRRSPSGLPCFLPIQIQWSTLLALAFWPRALLEASLLFWSPLFKSFSPYLMMTNTVRKTNRIQWVHHSIDSINSGPPPPAWATLVCFRSSKYNAPAKGNPNGYEMIEWRVSLNNRNDIISPKFVRCPLNYCCRCERSLSNCISASSAFIKLTSSGFKSSRGRWTIFSRASNIVALTSFVRHPTFFFRWT